jgi:hypothetical protein
LIICFIKSKHSHKKGPEGFNQVVMSISRALLYFPL